MHSNYYTEGARLIEGHTEGADDIGEHTAGIHSEIRRADGLDGVRVAVQDADGVGHGIGQHDIRECDRAGRIRREGAALGRPGCPGQTVWRHVYVAGGAAVGGVGDGIVDIQVA